METSTFNSADGKYSFTVKTEFLKKCPDYLTMPTFDLMTKFKMNQFLHNTSGPAAVRLKDGRVDYWVEGQIVSPEIGERMAHNYAFGNKILDTINE